MVDVTFTNSYIETDAIFEAWIGNDPRPSAIALKAASSTTQEWYLQRATKIIDSLSFGGYKLLSTQDRQFPRKYDPTDSLNPWGNTYSEDSWGYIYDSSDVPDDVKEACCEEALALYEFYTDSASSKRQSLQNQGVKSYSIGPLSETFGTVEAGGSSTYGLKSTIAYDLLQKYISTRGDIR
jgi:hypothetical protein